MNWLHVGTSPAVLQQLPLAKLRRWDAVTTCNSGISLVPFPTYWFAIDQGALDRFEPQVRYAQTRGTECVTLHLGRDVDWCDHFLDRMPGNWISTEISGAVALQWACLHGAETITLIGCDGYRGRTLDGLSHYWDGHVGNLVGCVQTERQANVFRRIARRFPDVSFVQMGEPIYRVDAENWTVAGKNI